MPSRTKNAAVFVSLVVLVAFSALLFRSQKQKDAEKQSIVLPQSGHLAVVRVAEKLGLPIAPSVVYSLLPPNEKGHSVQQLAEALQSLGLHTDIRREELNVLLVRKEPVVVQLEKPEHFVVSLGLEGTDEVLVSDEKGIARVLSMVALRNRSTGYGIVVHRDVDSKLSPQSSVASVAPALQFDTLFADKGRIMPSQKEVRFEFPFRNNGDKPLTIKNVHSSCSGIRMEYPKKAVAPGETNSVVAIYSVDPEKPVVLEEVTVESNDSAFPAIVLHASGRLNRTVQVTPVFLDYGLCAAGEPRRKRVFLRFRGVAKTPDIHAVIQDSEHFTIETITDAATFDAKHIWEQASERPAHATQWPIAVIEVTMKTKPSETTTIHTELIVDAKVPGYEHYVIPIEARIVSVD